LKLPDKGTHGIPWINFNADSDTGFSVIDSKAIFILDGKECDNVVDWLNGCQEKGHIDRLTKYAIIAAIATGDGVMGAIIRRFSKG